MTLQLEIVSEHRELVGDDCVRLFSEDGGTIGRSLHCDWILPDPDRYISARHATVDFQAGAYYLADVSTNGVYVNDEHEPIGRGNPRRLYSGDRLRMGDFEFTVSVDEGEGLELPEPPAASVVPDNIEQLVPEITLRTGIEMLGEEEITGDEEFQSALFGVPNSKARSVRKKPAPTPADRPAIRPKRVEVTSDDLLDTFLDGLGISRADLHPSVDPAEVMQNAGEVMKEFVEGMNKLLISRGNLKTAFRLDQTTILPRANNPLKLSENIGDSIKQLLVGRAGEYLGPRDAVREVCRDLLFHQDAFIDSMSSALTDFSDRFAPEELMENFDSSIDAKPMLGFLNKLKYWQLYCDLYPIMTGKGGGRFPQMFAEEFVKAYERQINESKRSDPSESPQVMPKLSPLSEQQYNAEMREEQDDYPQDEPHADQADTGTT
jgi:predicted component of type VI protein secretion system